MTILCSIGAYIVKSLLHLLYRGLWLADSPSNATKQDKPLSELDATYTMLYRGTDSRVYLQDSMLSKNVAL